MENGPKSQGGTLAVSDFMTWGYIMPSDPVKKDNEPNWSRGCGADGSPGSEKRRLATSHGPARSGGAF